MDGDFLAAAAGSGAGKPGLARRLNAWHATAIVGGHHHRQRNLPGPGRNDAGRGFGAGVVYAVWIVGGLLSFFGALTYAELGAMKPRAGGEYIFIRDAYGEAAGFLYAWTWFHHRQTRLHCHGDHGNLCACSAAFLGAGLFSRGRRLRAVLFRSRAGGNCWPFAVAIFFRTLNYVGVQWGGKFSNSCLTLLKVALGCWRS